MKSLETVQKAFGVFKKLTKIAEILCIVGAAVAAAAALCTVVSLNGGRVFSIFGTPIEIFTDGDPLAEYVRLLAFSFTLTADAVLFGLADNYLKHELADGTPFTEAGAKRVRMLGIRCIYIPIIAVSVSGAVAVWQGVKNVGIPDNLTGISCGAALILISLVFRYGSELENQNRAVDQDKSRRNTNEK